MEALTEILARSFWLFAFSDAIERELEDGGDSNAREFHPGPGGDWADMVPSAVPKRFKVSAARILSGLPADTLASGMSAWKDLSGCDDDRFGHCLAAQILGHGVGLSDDLPPRGEDFPLLHAAVRALSETLPCLDCSGEFDAEWNSVTSEVE